MADLHQQYSLPTLRHIEACLEKRRRDLWGQRGRGYERYDRIMEECEMLEGSIQELKNAESAKVEELGVDG